MNFFKTLAGLFSQKKTPAQKLILPQQKLFVPSSAITIGILDEIYSPQEFIVWLKQRNGKKYKNSQVELLDVSQFGLYAATIFAVTEGDTVYWTQVGTNYIHASTKSSLTTSKSESFRLLIKDKGSKQIKAICCLKNNKIEVIDIVEERFVPPTDNDEERKVRCKGLFLPCSLVEAADAVKFL